MCVCVCVWDIMLSMTLKEFLKHSSPGWFWDKQAGDKERKQAGKQADRQENEQARRQGSKQTSKQTCCSPGRTLTYSLLISYRLLHKTFRFFKQFKCCITPFNEILGLKLG